MSFGAFLMAISVIIFFSEELHDYIKNGRFINLLATVFSAIGILTILINYAKG